MSEAAIRAEHGGLAIEVTVSTRGTADDFQLCLDAALRAVAAALVRPDPPFDQDATQQMPVSAEEYEKRLREVPY